MNWLSKILIFLISISGLLSARPVIANDLIQWQSSNIQYLRGHDYELGERQRSIITIEHANKWIYGDSFAFIDLIYPDGQDSSYYAEISPRLSLGKISGKDLSFGIISDVLVSTTFEKPRGQGPQYLYGLAVNLDVPGFRFLSLNGYVHDNTELSGKTWQSTLAWNRPFQIGSTQFLAEGFADFQGKEDTSHANQLIVPRLLLDLGGVTGTTENKLFIGVEYQYWHNKFGIKGKTESVPQLQLKWVI